MKKILIVLLSGILTLSITAQTVNLTFNGANKNINYQVVLDGTSYYSNSSTYATSSGANVRREITLNNQRLGSHKISVYRLKNNSGSYRNGTNIRPYGTAIYSNTFQIRQGYDMLIRINGNGRVMFSENRIEVQSDQVDDEQNNISPMSDTKFDQLLQSVRSKYLQSSKLTAVRNAFLNTQNYFTTEQVSQLLSLITTEANRLALAKLAYPRVTDPADFPQLYEIFSSEASKDEMNTFIRNNPNNNNSNTRWNNNNSNNNPNNNTRTAMADYQFNQLLQTVNSQYSQSGKITVITGAFNNSANWFSTSQLRQLLSLINSESDRLTLAKQSYARVSDASAFTSLYDLFYSQSSRDDLNNFIRGNTNPQSNTRTAMADYQFNQLLQTINNQYSQSGKVTAITGAFNNTANWFSTSQLRQLLFLVNSESDRLALAKQSYARVSDASAFTSLYDLFYSQSSRDDLNNFINGNTNPQGNTRTVMADYQFNQLIQNINSQYNQGGKFNAINSAFNTAGNYFSTAQIRQLLSLVNSESDRLALAKLSYLRVTDPVNFTTIYDLLTSQASRNELNTYVMQNGGTGTTVQTTTRVAVSDALFNQLHQKAKNHIRPSSTVNDLKVFFTNNSYYFSTAQIRQLLSLISSSILSPLASETDMLEVAKLSWHRVTDPGNFTQLFDLFTSQANRDALNAYIQARPY